MQEHDQSMQYIRFPMDRLKGTLYQVLRNYTKFMMLALKGKKISKKNLIQ